MYMLSFASTS